VKVENDCAVVRKFSEALETLGLPLAKGGWKAYASRLRLADQIMSGYYETPAAVGLWLAGVRRIVVRHHPSL